MNELPIYSIASFDTQEETLYVNNLAEHLEKHHFIHHPHKHDFYLCVFFTKGKGTHEVDFVNHHIEPGSVFFLKPGQFHHWTFKQKAEGFIFFHSKAFYDLNYQNRQLHDFPFYSSTYNSPVFYCPKEEVAEIKSLFESLVIESSKNNYYSSIASCSLIDLIYIFCAQRYVGTENSPIKSSSYFHKMIQFEEFVERYFTTSKMPHTYADLMNISIKHLNRIVKQTLNKTASEVISDRVVLEAKRILVHSDYRINEVADQLGFEDYSYFTRYFKKHTGETPIEFARKVRK